MPKTALELIRDDSRALDPMALERWKPEAMAAIWQTTAKGLTFGEFGMFIALAARHRLDPNLHEVWAIAPNNNDGERGRVIIMVGRDGLLTVARRHEDFVAVDGDVHRANDVFRVHRLPTGERSVEQISEGSVEKRGKIEGSWAMVRRHRDGEPDFFTNYTYTPLAEYMPKNEKKIKFSPWGSTISAMIAKCSASLSLRIGYGVSGVVGEDEMWAERQRWDAEGSAVDLGENAGWREESPEEVAGRLVEDLQLADETLRERFVGAFVEAAAVRPGEVSPASVQMALSGQTRERIDQWLDMQESQSRQRRMDVARAEDVDASTEPVVDAEVIEGE